MPQRPWGRWENPRRIEHFRPLAPNVVYIPAAATNGRAPLDNTSLLVRVTSEEGSIAAFIKNNWKPRGAFRVTKANQQSFKIGFHERLDFERLQGKKWEFMGRDILLVRVWRSDESTAEDPLQIVPQKAIIHNIPKALWGDEAIGRIASALGKPLDAKSKEPLHQLLPPPLKVCVVVDRNFN